MGSGEDFAEEMRYQNDRGATRSFGFHEGEKLLGCDGVKGGCGFIKHHKFQRFGRDGESTRDFGHLTFADRQVCDFIVGRNAVSGEDFIELLRDEFAGFGFPAPALDGAMGDAGVFSDG